MKLILSKTIRTLPLPRGGQGGVEKTSKAINLCSKNIFHNSTINLPLIQGEGRVGLLKTSKA